MEDSESEHETGCDEQELIEPHGSALGKGPSFILSCRGLLAAMIVISFFNALAVRNTFTIAFVAMVNFSKEQNQNESNGFCPENNAHSNHTETIQGEFNWDPTLQGVMLGAFYYGYSITQIPSGYFAERFGAKKMFTLMSLMSGLLTIVLPFLARWGPVPIISAQFINGLFQGPLFPAGFAMISRWFPPDERTFVYAMSNGVSTGGIMVNFIVTGFLCKMTFLGGWPAAFYLFGGVSVIWTLVWVLVVHEKPAHHPKITKEELDYIESCTGNLDNIKYEMPPWKSILKSAPVYGVAIVIITDNFGTYVLGNCMPIYLKQVLGIDVQDNGLVNAGCDATVMLVSFFAGWCADFLRKRQTLQVINIRRLFVILGEVMPGVFLVLLGYIGCNQQTAIVILIITMAWNGLSVAGTHPTMFDIAPLYAGTLCGISNGIGNLCGFLAPSIVSLVTHNSGDLYLWRKMFFLTCGIFVFGAVMFSLLATDNEQTWARKQNPEETSCDSSEKHSITSS